MLLNWVGNFSGIFALNVTGGGGGGGKKWKRIVWRKRKWKDNDILKNSWILIVFMIFWIFSPLETTFIPLRTNCWTNNFYTLRLVPIKTLFIIKASNWTEPLNIFSRNLPCIAQSHFQVLVIVCCIHKFTWLQFWQV